MVTSKRDVREAAARLPDEPDDSDLLDELKPAANSELLDDGREAVGVEPVKREA